MRLVSKILVTGAGGQLGLEMLRLWGDEAVGVDRQSLDIADAEATRATIERLRPRAVVNCAAYTAVDRAEQDTELCRAVNALAVGYLAESCEKYGSRLAHVSTDYVFDGPYGASGQTPFDEQATPSPQSVYAKTKLEGEQLAMRCPGALVVRTCGLYGVSPQGRNFVETMLRFAKQGKSLRVVDDQLCTPTFTKHLAAALAFLIDSGVEGLFHVTNGGHTTWCAFAKEIFSQAGLSPSIAPITAAEYGAAAARPAYSVLDTSKYHRLKGPVMPDWRAALGEYLVDRERAQC